MLLIYYMQKTLQFIDDRTCIYMIFSAGLNILIWQCNSSIYCNLLFSSTEMIFYMSNYCFRFDSSFLRQQLIEKNREILHLKSEKSELQSRKLEAEKQIVPVRSIINNSISLVRYNIYRMFVNRQQAAVVPAIGSNNNNRPGVIILGYCCIVCMRFLVFLVASAYLDSYHTWYYLL